MMPSLWCISMVLDHCGHDGRGVFYGESAGYVLVWRAIGVLIIVVLMADAIVNMNEVMDVTGLVYMLWGDFEGHLKGYLGSITLMLGWVLGSLGLRARSGRR